MQTGILEPVPPLARYLTFSLRQDGEPRRVLGKLPGLVDGRRVVVGIGECLMHAVNAEVPGIKTFPALTGPAIAIQSTPRAFWIWLRGDDRGELLHETRRIRDALVDHARLVDVIDAFCYGDSLDLTGYEDGTENPTGDEAQAAGFVSGAGTGLDGSSFVAVQQWQHDLDHFQSLPRDAQDNIIGRRKADNEEFDEAPASAHVKRTAQESFDPEAFILRRSMPWATAQNQGLVFVAFGRSVDACETLLRPMVGLDDGIVDGLFSFTRPLSGAYFWCPPVQDGRLDLRALGL